MKTYCFALDLVDDPQLIAEYEKYHQRIWPEIAASIKNSGITGMRIYRVANRLMMVMETSDEFTLEAKASADKANPRVEEWEKLMWKYQQAIPGSAPGEKWRRMELIFDLDKNS